MTTAESFPGKDNEPGSPETFTPEEIIEIAKEQIKKTNGFFDLPVFTAMINESALGGRLWSTSEQLAQLGLKSTAEARKKLEEIHAQKTETVKGTMDGIRAFGRKVLKTIF